MVSSVAFAKPKVLVLGLEPQATVADMPATRGAAGDLTAAIRTEASGALSPYVLLGQTPALSEAKTLADCDDEKPACMAGIGKDAGADLVLYGHVKKTASGFDLDLALVEVSKKSVSKTATRSIADASRAQGVGPVLFASVAGLPTTGSLHVSSNVPGATVTANGVALGPVSQETFSLEIGDVDLTVKADGYEPFQTVATIAAGGTARVDATLKKSMVVTPPTSEPVRPPVAPIKPRVDEGDSSSGHGARVAFVATSVVTLAAVAGLVVFGLQEKSAETAEQNDIAAWGNGYQSNGVQFPNDMCAEARNDNFSRLVKDCDAANTDALIANVSLGVGIAAAAASVYFGYEGFVHAKRTEKVSVVPLFGPTVGASATVRF
jgi:hypothetical protein